MEHGVAIIPLKILITFNLENPIKNIDYIQAFKDPGVTMWHMDYYVNVVIHGFLTPIPYGDWPYKFIDITCNLHIHLCIC